MDACVEHTQGSGKDVYASATYRSRQTKLHRLVYAKAHGLDVHTALVGLVVRHRCDNKRCINPNHLELGTQKDNIRDRIERGRAPKSNPKIAGERNVAAKLTAEEAAYVRHAVGRQVDIAAAFGITQATVSKIKRGAAWAHL